MAVPTIDPNDLIESFGPMLKRLRCEARGYQKGKGCAECVLTQDDLSYMTGISRITLTKYEGGRSKNPDRQNVRLIADALNLSGEIRHHFFEAAGAQYIGPSVVLDPSLERIYDLMNDVDLKTRRKIVGLVHRFAGRLEEAYSDR